jgi:hypothetical protein
VARNEQLAAERFIALQEAVARTVFAALNPAELCDGSVLARNYTGPAFTDDDLRRVTGNYVRQGGYSFVVFCREQDGYIIHAEPYRERQDGNKRFCSDQSGKIACGMEWNGSRYLCVPCSR